MFGTTPSLYVRGFFFSTKGIPLREYFQMSMNARKYMLIYE